MSGVRGKSWLRPIAQGLGFAVLIAQTPIAAAEDKILLDANGAVITEDDFVHYVEQRFKDADVEGGLSRPGAFIRVVEDLYVIERLSTLAKESGVVDLDALVWLAQDTVNRTAMAPYIEREVNYRLADTDWEGVARERYIAAGDQYAGVEEVSVDHILVSPEDRSWDDYTATVALVEKELTSNDDFGAVAAEYSDDASVEFNRGHLGFVRRGQMVKPFEDAIWELANDGEVIGPVITRFGAHFIKYNGRRMSPPVPFEDVRDDLIAEIQRKRGSAVRQDIINEIREELADATATIDESAIRERLGIVESEITANQGR